VQQLFILATEAGPAIQKLYSFFSNNNLFEIINDVTCQPHSFIKRYEKIKWQLLLNQVEF